MIYLMRDGGTQIETFFKDGQLARLTGTTVRAREGLVLFESIGAPV